MSYANPAGLCAGTERQYLLVAAAPVVEDPLLWPRGYHSFGPDLSCVDCYRDWPCVAYQVMLRRVYGEDIAGMTQLMRSVLALLETAGTSLSSKHLHDRLVGWCITADPSNRRDGGRAPEAFGPPGRRNNAGPHRRSTTIAVDPSRERSPTTAHDDDELIRRVVLASTPAWEVPVQPPVTAAELRARAEARSRSRRESDGRVRDQPFGHLAARPHASAAPMAAIRPPHQWQPETLLKPTGLGAQVHCLNNAPGPARCADNYSPNACVRCAKNAATP